MCLVLGLMSAMSRHTAHHFRMKSHDEAFQSKNPSVDMRQEVDGQTWIEIANVARHPGCHQRIPGGQTHES